MAATLANVMLSTKDNPYDYFTEFDKWYTWDSTHDHACEILARVATTSEFLSDELNNSIVEEAIDSLLLHDPEQRFVKVYRKQNA